MWSTEGQALNVGSADIVGKKTRNSGKKGGK